MLKTLPELIAEARSGQHCIDAETAVGELANGSGVLIDVREPMELEACRTAGAVNIPRGVLEMKVGEICPDSEQPIYLHCATGGRATLAGEQLQRMGYSNVSVITCAADKIREIQQQS